MYLIYRLYLVIWLEAPHKIKKDLLRLQKIKARKSNIIRRGNIFSRSKNKECNSIGIVKWNIKTFNVTQNRHQEIFAELYFK